MPGLKPKMGSSFFKTREMAYAMAVDHVRLSSSDPYSLTPWTDDDHNRFVAEFRRLWTLDEDFAEQEFRAKHGRRPSPLSESDWHECRAIHQAQLADRGGVLLGMAPDI